VITSDEEEEPRRKKPKEADFFADNADFVQFDEVEGELDLDREEGFLELTAAQEAVVEMAMNGENMFLTGAAGSGKTATLKEILRRLRKNYLREGSNGPEGPDSKFPRVQVVAPTGIAALPLNGKTTYSFAGWYVRRFPAMWFFNQPS
jgi:Cdc6-like AAA superfamily ATPase